MAKSENISRIEIFCDDRLVMPIKRMLLGMKGVHKLDDQPVVNAQASKNGVTARSSGRGIDLLAAYLKDHKLNGKIINAKVGREFAKSIGRAEGGYNSIFAQACEQGLLVKNKAKNFRMINYTVHLKG